MKDPIQSRRFVFILVLTAVRALSEEVTTPATNAPVPAAETGVAALKGLSLEDLMNVQVTTVSRTESTIRQSPAAITVITPDDIRRSGATTIPELFRMVPGMHVARIDGNKWAIDSRGFNNRFAKNLLVQVDGRSVYSPQTAGAFWDAVDYPLQDIDRIEVIRGPGGSVWGANAVSGVINIVTKSAKDTQGALVSGGGGNQEQGFGMFRYGDKIGDNLYFRLYGKGFNRAQEYSAEGDPNDQWWGASGGIRADWMPNEIDVLTLESSFLRSVTGTKDSFPVTNGPPYSVSIPEEDTTDDSYVLTRWAHQPDPDSGWALQVYWDRWQRTDADHHFRDTLYNTYDVDFQHQFTLGERQKFVWGLGYRYVDADLNPSQDDGGFFLDWLDYNSYMQIFSGFIQDEIALMPDYISLTLGLKPEYNNFTGFEFQPSGRLLWTPTERQSMWAAVSRAVRTPSFTEHEALFTVPPSDPANPPSTRIVANRDLNAEELLALELGYRIQATEAVSVDLATFYNIHHRLRVNQLNPALSSTLPPPLLFAAQFDNGMDGETYGVELAANWLVTDWWRLYGAYTFLQIHLRGNTAGEAAAGQDPQNQVFLRSSWNLPGNLEFDLLGRYVGELSGFNPAGLPGVSDTVNAYFALDARLAWRPFENLELAVVGQNLNDDHHPEFGTNPFIRSPLVEIKRSVYGVLTWSF